MKRVEANGNWWLFCPNEAVGMQVYGEEFEALYEKYETEGRARKTMAQIPFKSDPGRRDGLSSTPVSLDFNEKDVPPPPSLRLLT